MMPSPKSITPRLFTCLPGQLRYRGEPNAWVKVTRPGMRLHSFLEGACVNASGEIWIVDVPYGRIFCVDAAGIWREAHCYDGEPHGLALNADGRLAVADYRHGLRLFDPATQSLTPLCTRFNTESFKGLSDVKYAPNGDMWFTDPGRSSLVDPTGRLFRMRPGNAPELILSNIPYPNGVALNGDGTLVYVSVTRANAIWQVGVASCDLGFPMAGVFAHLSGGLGPDGLAVNGRGHVAVAQAQAGRVYVFDKLGDLLYEIRLPEGRWTTSVDFSPDGYEIFIVEAERGAIWRAQIP